MNNIINGNLSLLWPALLNNDAGQNQRIAANTATVDPNAAVMNQQITAAIESFMAQLLSTLADYLAANSGQGSLPGTGTGAASGSPSGARHPASKGGSTGKAQLGGFIWKPKSDSNGNLVILLPPELSAQESQVSVVSPEGKTLASGKMGGIGNGNRRHFRFDRPGSSFPDGSTVVVKLADGTVKTVKIANTAERKEVKHLS